MDLYDFFAGIGCAFFAAAVLSAAVISSVWTTLLITTGLEAIKYKWRSYRRNRA